MRKHPRAERQDRTYAARRPTAEELREHPWTAVNYAPVLESLPSVGSPSPSRAASGLPAAGADGGEGDDIFAPTVAARRLSKARASRPRRPPEPRPCRTGGRAPGPAERGARSCRPRAPRPAASSGRCAQEEQSRAAEQVGAEAAAVPAAKRLNAFQVRARARRPPISAQSARRGCAATRRGR